MNCVWEHYVRWKWARYINGMCLMCDCVSFHQKERRKKKNKTEWREQQQQRVKQTTHEQYYIFDRMYYLFNVVTLCKNCTCFPCVCVFNSNFFCFSFRFLHLLLLLLLGLAYFFNWNSFNSLLLENWSLVEWYFAHFYFGSLASVQMCCLNDFH